MCPPKVDVGRVPTDADGSPPVATLPRAKVRKCFGHHLPEASISMPDGLRAAVPKKTEGQIFSKLGTICAPTLVSIDH